MKPIVIYSRKDCHLCGIMIEELQPLISGRLDLVVHDVDSRDDWREKYHTRIANSNVIGNSNLTRATIVTMPVMLVNCRRQWLKLSTKGL